MAQKVGPRAALSKYPWLGYSIPEKVRHITEFMNEHAAEARVACRYEDLLSMYAALRVGAGIGFLPCAFADPDPELVRLRPVQAGFGYDIWCLAHPDLSATARVRTFIEHARAYFEARAALYAGHQGRRAKRPN